MEQTTRKNHILLTSLGKNAYNTKYKMQDKEATAPLAPLALLDFFKMLELPMPDRVVAVVTEGAQNTTLPILQDGVRFHLDIEPELIPIPDGRNKNEIRKILESVADPKYIQEGSELTLDVTHGLRHFPFIFYALTLYLKSLRGVKLLGAFYGMAETNEPKPIIDLQPLLELPEWFHAVRMFRDHGTTKPMADLLQPFADTLTQQKKELFTTGSKKAGMELTKDVGIVTGSVDWLQRYAFAYESALPLELEKASEGIVNVIGELPTINSVDPPLLVTELTDTIVDVAEKTAFENPPAKKGQWKGKIPLDIYELQRQAFMIDLYLEREQLSLAVGLMREWVVSWVIWKSGKTQEIAGWLRNKNVRIRYEGILGAIGDSAKKTGPKLTLTAEHEEFRTFWNHLTANLRNAFHHHGMRIETLEKEPASLQKVKTYWERLKVDGLKKKGGIDVPPLGGRLLISPQGNRAGVLFSALKVTEPDTCLVICSSTSVATLSDAASHANFEGYIERIILNDPFGGFAEIDAVAEDTKGYLTFADEVLASITGGTTLMGVIVQRIVEEAQKLGRPVRRFALIDRRPTEVQDSDPFVESDYHWLDDQEKLT